MKISRIKSLLLFVVFTILTFNSNAISIWEARKNGPTTTCTVSGIVLNGSELGNARYIWDGTAAICAFGSNIALLVKGDSVTISGTIIDYNSLLEISPVTSFTVISSNKPLPNPELCESYQLAEYNEGALMKLNNVLFVNPSATFSANTTYIITSNGLKTELFVKSGNSLVGQAIPSNPISVIGICSQYGNDYQIMPRGTSDIFLTPFYILQSPSVSNQTSSSFQLNFTTSLNSKSYARYGLTSALELGIVPGTIGVSSHSISLSGLQSATKYYVQTFAVSALDTAKSVIKCYSTKSLLNGSIRVLFNRPVDNTKANPSTNLAIRANFSLADTIAALIDHAQSTLEVAVYSFNSGTPQPIITAINAAANRGVAVRYIYDFGMPNSALLSIGSNVKKIASPAPLSTNEYNIMHNKFVVIDANAQNAMVIAGSTNFTGGQLNYDANNLIVISDQAIARNYLDEFNEMWGTSGINPDLLQSRFGYYKRDNTSHEFLVNGKRTELYFSPSDNTAEHIRTSILSADNDLYFANLIFTQTELSDAIINRNNNGVFESGLINDTANADPTAFLSMKAVMNNNLQLYDFNNQAGILHHKYCIIDQSHPSNDPMVVSGSHNWTYTANTQNDENMLIMHDGLIANQYYQEFVSRFNENGGALSLDENSADKKILVFPNPVKDILSLRTEETLLSNADILITDILGRYIDVKKVKTGNGEITFDVSALSPGSYMINCKTKTSSRNIGFIKQ